MKNLLIALCLSTVSVFADPYRLIILPSAEGPSSHHSYNNIAVAPNGPLFKQTLNEVGQRRAAYLVGYFLGTSDKKPLFSDMVSSTPDNSPIHPITYIAAYFTKGNKGNFRPIETISPLANVIFYEQASTSAYNYAPSTVKQFSMKMISEIKRDLQAISHTAIICWDSRDIPALIRALEPSLEKNTTFQQTFPNGKFPKKDPSYLTFVITYNQLVPSFVVYQQEKKL